MSLYILVNIIINIFISGSGAEEKEGAMSSRFKMLNIQYLQVKEKHCEQRVSQI